MPPTSEMLEKAAEALAAVSLQSFTATPSTITPFGADSVLRWKVKRPTGSIVRLFLQGASIGTTGTKTVSPEQTSVFRIVARALTLQRTLGSVTVNVDSSGCISSSIPESTVQLTVRNAMTAQLASIPQLSQRSPASVEVASNGITVKLRFAIAINNFADPDLNVDFRFTLRASSGQAVVTITSFDTEVSWPWWVTVVTIGISQIVEEIIANRIEKEIRPMLQTKLKEMIDAQLAALPSTHRLHVLSTSTDQINFTVCPV
ncbi:hypothetical protein [Spirosoma sp.]|uniref:hypothetical protein n=1 Tax=Spirosoma sp. TaxID=1899569 RepID=UPI003B3B04C9